MRFKVSNIHLCNRECGNTIPDDIIGEVGDSITVQFCSDGAVRRRGFRARYSFIDGKYYVIHSQKCSKLKMTSTSERYFATQYFQVITETFLNF